MSFSLPNKQQVLKGTGWLLGMLLLSALGSGCWESVLRPAFHSIARWVLDIASLGLAGYKNSVYRQIAEDNQSALSLVTLIWVTAMYALMIAILTVYQFGMNDRTRSKGQDLLRKLSGDPPKLDPDLTVDTLKQQLAANLKSVSRARVLLYVSSLFVCVAFVNWFVWLARIGYVNSADAHYHQVLRVASPYLESREQAQVESDFAQISSRDDYVRLISRLESQCKVHGRAVPPFDAW